MEMGTILIAIFAYVIIKNHMEQLTKERARKLQLLEEAIKSGNVDRELIHELAASVSGRRTGASPGARSPGICRL